MGKKKTGLKIGWREVCKGDNLRGYVDDKPVEGYVSWLYGEWVLVVAREDRPHRTKPIPLFMIKDLERVY